MVRPSGFAVLRLMTNSNLADCLIGSLPGFGCFPKRRGQTGQLPVLSRHWSPCFGSPLVGQTCDHQVDCGSDVAHREAISRVSDHPHNISKPKSCAFGPISIYPANLSGGCRTMRPLFVWHEYMQCDAWLPPMVTTILAAKSVLII